MILKSIRMIGVLPQDSEDTTLTKNILVFMALAISVAGLFWGLFYWILGLFYSAVFPISYTLAIIISLLIFSKIKNFNFLFRTQLILITIIPFFLQLSLGGFISSGAVFLWALLAPMGALMFSSIKEAVIWFYIFIILLVTCLVCSNYHIFYFELPEITETINNIFFGINIIAVTVITFASTLYFVTVRNETKEKNSELLKITINEKQEIKASINYAKLLQDAILTNPKDINSCFETSFILSRPRDIVSGDFYWLNALEDESVFLAVADSTGHGIPGALVSIVCNNALETSVKDFGLTNPNEILNKSRELIIKSFSTGVHQLNDGMDISLCLFNSDKSKMCYSGASSTIYIISQTGQLTEIKGDRIPVGKFIHKQPYTKFSYNLNRGDTVYLFSDGYVDQFGGVDNKKFKTKGFKSLLLSIYNKPMDEQKALLEKNVITWKGKRDQTDDIMVVGVRV